MVGTAAALMRPMGFVPGGALPDDSFTLTLRLGIGVDLEKMLGGLLDAHLESRHLRSIHTARQGIAIDVSYTTRLKATCSPDDLVKAGRVGPGLPGPEGVIAEAPASLTFEGPFAGRGSRNWRHSIPVTMAASEESAEAADPGRAEAWRLHEAGPHGGVGPH